MTNEILFVPTKVRQRRPCIRGGAALSSPRPTLGRRAPSGPTPAGDNPPNDTRGEMVLAACYGSCAWIHARSQSASGARRWRERCSQKGHEDAVVRKLESMPIAQSIADGVMR